MKLLCLLLLHLALLSHLLADDPDKRQLEWLEEVKGVDWVSFSIGSWHNGGDFTAHSTELVLQRTPDGRILLSKNVNRSKALPVAIRFVNDAEAATIRSAAIELLTQAIREENEFDRMRKRDEPARMPLGYEYDEIRLRAQGKRSFRFAEAAVDSGSDSMIALRKFLKQNFNPEKANKSQQDKPQ